MLELVQFIRHTYSKHTIISVEFEKPDRPDISSLLPWADVCFFSKHFAESKGFPNAPTGFLDNYRIKCKDG
jgi:ketohexokinase